MAFVDDFKMLSEKVFKVCDLQCTLPKAEVESHEYQAYTFRIGKKNIRYRLAKVTPTKVGQFVTLWKRIGNSVIQPFESTDDLDLFVVTVKNHNRIGQFVFPKDVLIRQGILAVKGVGGKRALRVYPPWDKTESKQALKTQTWQLQYFYEISEKMDLEKIRSLYSQ